MYDFKSLFPYVLIILLTIFFIWWEYTDCNYKNGPFNSSAEDFGTSIYLKGCKATDKDNIKNIIQKTKKASFSEENMIRWRRSLILAVSSTVLINFFLYKRLMKWTKFCIYVFCISTVSLNMFYFYNYHVSDKSRKTITNNLDLLYKKYKLKNKTIKKGRYN